MSRSDAVAAGRRVTLAGMAVNLGLMAAKFAIGILGNSRALVADAVHSMSDLFTDLVVLFGLAMGSREPDDRHHFGHGRVETLAVAVVSLSLAAVGVFLAWDAGKSLFLHEVKRPSWVVLVGAAASILFKEGLDRYTVRVGLAHHSRVIVANAWHHRSDALSSVAVLAGVAGTLIAPELAILDAVAAIVVAALVLKVGVSLFREALREFTDTAPEPVVLDSIRQCVQDVPGVLDMHDLKVRTSAGLIQMQLHIVVRADLTVAQGHAIAKDVEHCVHRDVDNVVEAVIHVDPALPVHGAAHTLDDTD